MSSFAQQNAKRTACKARRAPGGSGVGPRPHPKGAKLA